MNISMEKIMDNNILVNNPLTPYLQPTVQEKGLLCFVDDFEEFRRMPHTKGNDYIAVTKDLKYMFIKRVDNEGNVNLATFDPNQIPNPVPVTEVQLSVRISELESNINTQISEIKSQIGMIFNKIMEGDNNESSKLLQSKTDLAGTLGSKEPVFKQ